MHQCWMDMSENYWPHQGSVGPVMAGARPPQGKQGQNYDMQAHSEL